MKSAIVLCSGGLDSVVTANYIRKKYKKIKILFFNYGQRNVAPEREFSKICAKKLKAEFVELDLKYLGKLSTSLLNSNSKEYRFEESLKNTEEESIKWYVPSRNLIFLSNAVSLAESHFIREKISSDIFVGFKNEGEDFYPDTTQDFLDSLNKVSRVSTNGKFKIFAPLIRKDKEDIVRLAIRLKVDMKKTYSCYVGGKKHCGSCLACKLRKQGFYWANEEDPTTYLEQ